MAKRKMNPNSLKNLEKNNFKNKTPAERSELAAKGAEATNKIKAEKANLKRLMEIALEREDDISGEKNDMAITLSLIDKAKQGDVSAYNAIRDILGQKPVDAQVNLEVGTEEAKIDQKHVKKVIETVKELVGDD